MKFSYTALGSDSQKLTGTLEAGSLELAREELHKMGLSVISLSEAKPDEQIQAPKNPEKTAAPQQTPPPEAAGIVNYFFSAKDGENKPVQGTIEAQDPYSAYKRLIIEYQFEVLDLFEHGAMDPASASLKDEFEGWKMNMQQEGLNPKPRKASVKNELGDEGEKMAEEIVQEIDHFILNTKKILAEHQTQYSKAFLSEIETTLGKLERIRSSNNLKHITKVCNDLYELISHPDLTPQSTEGSDEAYQQIVGNLKESGFVQNKFNFLEKRNLEQNADRFKGVKQLFSKIQTKLGKNTDKLEKNLQKKAATFQKAGQMSAQTEQGDTLKAVFKNLFLYLKESNPILRRARKQDALKSYEDWKARKKEPRQVSQTEMPAEKKGRDFTNFFMELDSFFGWLLFFYLSYFFLLSFALERNIGLPQALVIKTLSSPLILNVCIFLIFAHLALKLKLRLFARNALGTLFMFSLCFGGYALLIANF